PGAPRTTSPQGTVESNSGPSSTAAPSRPRPRGTATLTATASPSGSGTPTATSTMRWFAGQSSGTLGDAASHLGEALSSRPTITGSWSEERYGSGAYSASWFGSLNVVS